jgi:hypothetical protein
MTGALAMQSEAEIALLKKEVSMTGLITSELSDSYQALLPTMTKLTANAATESAAIVAQLQAGKLTVDQARAKIIQLNAQVESMIAQASVDIAGQQGRSIGLTTVPLLNQPVVNNAGKSNMKELARPGRTRDMLNKIARGLGVKTFGAGYSTETTIPKRFANGGMVYREKGSTGPEFKPMGTDTVPAMLTPGEFVVKADAVNKETLPFLQSLNEKESSRPFLSATMIHQGTEANQALAGNRPSVNLTGNYLANDLSSLHSRGLHPMALFYDQGLRLGYDKADLKKALNSAYVELEGSFRRKGDTPINNAYYEKVATNVAMKHLKTVSRFSPRIGRDVKLAEELIFMGHQRNSQNKGIQPGSLRTTGFDGVELPRHLVGTGSGFSGAANKTHFNLSQELYDETPSNLYKGPLGKGNTLSQVFNSQRGHTGSKFAPSRWNMLLNMVRSKIGRAPVVQDARSIALNKKWRGSKGFSNGGMVYMAGGGMVPSTQYFQEGSDGPVTPNRITFGSAYSQQREKGFVGKGMMGGPMAGMGIGMGMGMAGSAIGGQAGQIMQMASILPMMASNLLSGIPKMLGNISGGLKGVGGAAGLAGKAMGMFANAGPLLALTAAITVSYLAFKKFKEEQEQNRIEQSNSISITEKSAAEAGIKYNNLSNSIKAVNDQLELTRAKGKNAYESLNSSGVQGLTLSIKELRDNIKQAKTDQKELVSTFTNIDEGTDAQRQQKVLEIATNLKAQFIAAGMSAQDATNEIYSIISASDKAGMAFNAISSKGFREITDATTAANSMITKLGKNMNTLSADDLGQSISNATAALDVNLKKLMSTKDENGKIMTQQEAMSKILGEINSKQGAQTTITQGQIEALKKTHPALAEILNTSDNIAGMYSKWRLLLSGVRTDLSQISSEQAQSLAAFEAALDSAITASEKTSSGSGVTFKAQSSIAALQKLIAAGGQKAAVNAQKTQDQIKEEIKLIDKKIDKINEEADARKKALAATQSKENLAIEIQKAQLEYSDKMAAGDMAGAAQAQLKIKQLVGERETQKAIDAIEENRAKREKALIAEREKLQALSDKAAKNLSNAQNNAASATERMNKIDQYQNEYQRIQKEKNRVDVILEKDPTNKQALKDQTDLVRGPLGDLAKLISADAKGSDKALATELKKIFAGTLIDKEGNSIFVLEYCIFQVFYYILPY